VPDNSNETSASPGRTTLLPSPLAVKEKLSDIARNYVHAVREELEVDHWGGASGVDTATRYATAIDNLARFLFEAATARYARRYGRGTRSCAVIAQGGYGRSEMCPGSDVDLLVLYGNRVDAYVETVTETLLYSMWDAGLQVGHAVRNCGECVRLAAGDLTIRTALLDGRFVSGSTELGAQFTEVVQDVLTQRDVGPFIEAKRRENEARHARTGGSVFMLEPDIKEGRGGCRDLHTLLWITRTLRGVLSFEDMEERGILSADELEGLLAGREFLLRVRHSLHFLSGHKQDKMGFDLQEQVAERFGFEGDDNNSAADLFMRDYYGHAALIARTTDDIIDRTTAVDEKPGLVERLVRRRVERGVTVSGDRLVLEESILDADPLNLVRVFHIAQRKGVTLSSSGRMAVRRRLEQLVGDAGPPPGAFGAFLDVLHWEGGVYDTLAEMNSVGVLGKLLPEFGRLFCMVQRDYYHVYTVDEHSLMGVRELELLRDGEYEELSPLLTGAMRSCDDPSILYLAMMFHDAGKGYGSDHDERGAKMVVGIAERLGLDQDQSATLQFLVRNHLLMSDLAQHRDVGDPDLVAEFVAQVGSRKLLRDLYLVTFADMKAVGPKVWTSWKDNLLAELYMRAVDVMDKGLASENDAEARVERSCQRVAARAVPGPERESIEHFLSTMPQSYLISTPEETIYDHWLMYEQKGGASFRSGVVHFPERELTEFTVCTPDRPGLFASITGVLSAAGLSVVGARIATSTEGIALDAFQLDHEEPEADPAYEVQEKLLPTPMDPVTWKQVRDDLDSVLKEQADVGEIVAAGLKRPVLSSSAGGRAIERVELDNDVSRDHTVIDVYATDRFGLLYRLARTFQQLGLTVHLARVSNYALQARDVFYVTDIDGRKILDEGRLESLRSAVLVAAEGGAVDQRQGRPGKERRAS